MSFSFLKQRLPDVSVSGQINPRADSAMQTKSGCLGFRTSVLDTGAWFR